DFHVTGVQTCALPIWIRQRRRATTRGEDQVVLFRSLTRGGRETPLCAICPATDHRIPGSGSVCCPTCRHAPAGRAQRMLAAGAAPREAPCRAAGRHLARWRSILCI